MTTNAGSPSADPSRSENLHQTPSRTSLGSPASTIRTSSIAATMRLPMRTNPVPAAYTPKKRIIIRADPTLVSCFDPADKELYELWVPKQ